MTKKSMEKFKPYVDCAARILAFLEIEGTKSDASYDDAVALNKKVILGQMEGVGHTPYYAAASLILKRYINPLKEKNNAK